MKPATAINHREANAAAQSGLQQLGEALPELYRYSSRLHRTAVRPGVLSTKTKELMALSISVVQRCEEGISTHVEAAVNAGATRLELLETLGVAVMMGGNPATYYAAKALDALNEFLPAPIPPEPIAALDEDYEVDPFSVNAD
jgi:AhpD family alkylhydroperoxidase